MAVWKTAIQTRFAGVGEQASQALKLVVCAHFEIAVVDGPAALESALEPRRAAAVARAAEDLAYAESQEQLKQNVGVGKKHGDVLATGRHPVSPRPHVHHGYLTL